MDNLHKEAGSNAPTGVPAARRFLRTALSLTRPVVMGLLALLSILGTCQTYGSTASPGYQQPGYNESSTETPSSKTLGDEDAGSPESDAVPLLFLSFVGLAGMALSRTGSSKERREETVSPGQKISR